VTQLIVLIIVIGYLISHCGYIFIYNYTPVHDLSYTPGHVMISYNWSVQDEARELKEVLH